MKAYGVKNTELELNASHYEKLPGKGGDIRSGWKNSDKKRRYRRYNKKVARRAAKAEIASIMDIV